MPGPDESWGKRPIAERDRHELWIACQQLVEIIVIHQGSNLGPGDPGALQYKSLGARPPVERRILEGTDFRGSHILRAAWGAGKKASSTMRCAWLKATEHVKAGHHTVLGLRRGDLLATILV
jgi:hypothetical protein